jgi:hypothetical protein
MGCKAPKGDTGMKLTHSVDPQLQAAAAAETGEIDPMALMLHIQQLQMLMGTSGDLTQQGSISPEALAQAQADPQAAAVATGMDPEMQQMEMMMQMQIQMMQQIQLLTAAGQETSAYEDALKQPSNSGQAGVTTLANGEDGPWICSCGFKNKAINAVCGGVGPMGCKKPRPGTTSSASADSTQAMLNSNASVDSMQAMLVGNAGIDSMQAMFGGNVGIESMQAMWNGGANGASVEEVPAVTPMQEPVCQVWTCVCGTANLLSNSVCGGNTKRGCRRPRQALSPVSTPGTTPGTFVGAPMPFGKGSAPNAIEDTPHVMEEWSQTPPQAFPQAPQPPAQAPDDAAPKRSAVWDEIASTTDEIAALRAMMMM